MTFLVLAEREALGLPESDIERSNEVLRSVATEIITRAGLKLETRTLRLANYAIGYHLQKLDKGSAIGHKYD